MQNTRTGRRITTEKIPFWVYVLSGMGYVRFNTDRVIKDRNRKSQLEAFIEIFKKGLPATGYRRPATGDSKRSEDPDRSVGTVTGDRHLE